MADHHQRQCDAGLKTILPEKGPSSSQALAVVTLLPLGGFLLLLTGLTLTGTLIGLAVTTPLFVICSPVLVPAALVIAFSVLGFITSGAFGITALSSLSWMARYLRRMRLPEHVEHAKRRVQDTAGEVGHKARETGQSVQGKAQEVVKGQEDGQKQEGGSGKT